MHEDKIWFRAPRQVHMARTSRKWKRTQGDPRSDSALFSPTSPPGPPARANEFRIAGPSCRAVRPTPGIYAMATPIPGAGLAEVESVAEITVLGIGEKRSTP